VTDDRVWTAALVVIGDEILSGRTQDKNVAQVAEWLNQHGIRLAEVRIVPDEIGRIAETVNELRAAHDYLFTTGGIGPTHDDITVDAMAEAFGVPVVVHPAARRILEDYYRDRPGGLTEARLRMARVPDGAELIHDERLGFPTILCENVYILPGIPEILEQKFQALRDRFAVSPYFLRIVYTREGEGAIAEHLNATLAAFPELLLGSYPKIGDPEYAVKLTLESKDEGYVERALAHLLGLLPEEAVARTE